MNTKVNEKFRNNIINYTKNNEQKIKDYMNIIFYIILVFIVLFSVAKVIKTKTNFYRNDLKFRWDNILSYDDIYYAKRVYSQDENYEKIVTTISKHPFIKIIGQGFATVENAIFNNMNETDHYFHIVVFQIAINLLGVFFLYKILREQYKLPNKWCFTLLTIYDLATVTLLGTWVIETFIISSTLLIMSYYYLNKQSIIKSVILGILLTGVTVTNCIPFAIMAIILLKNKKDIIKIGISCIIGLILICFLLPYKDFLFNNFMGTVNQNVNSFAKEQTGITYIKMIFYYLLASPFFFIKQIHSVSNKGLDVIKFDLSSGKVIAIITIIFFIFIIYNIIRNIKDRKMLAALGVFVYNMILHAIVKFGLYEGTIYGLHFLFAEILMFAFGFKIQNKKIRAIFISFAIIFLIVQLRYNIKGMLEILLLLPNWK